MLILNLKTPKNFNIFLYQLIVENLIPITHNDLVYLKKMEYYQQTFFVITKMNGKNKNRDNINTY